MRASSSCPGDGESEISKLSGFADIACWRNPSFVEGRQAVTVYHGTIARRVESIGKDGLRPGDDGSVFVSGDEEIANEYALARVAYDMLHHGGPNRMLLVVARVPAERLSPASSRTGRRRVAVSRQRGRLQSGRWCSTSGDRGDVLHLSVCYQLVTICRGLEDPDGLAEVYRNHFYWKEMASALRTGSREFDQGLYDERGDPV